MKGGLRQSMAWLHTWAGLIVGWLLLAIFLTGTASYYRSEITRWMHPEIRHAAPASEAVALKDAMDWLHARAPQASSWLIDLPSARLPLTQVMWQEAGERRYTSQWLGPTTRETFGGDFFYGFHFQLSLPSLVGRWIVGIASMLMLIAIVSGVIVHRRIFKDFFTFRPGKGQRSWLDAHNSLSVLALPFHLLITYTGLVTLMFMYVPWGIDLAYGKDRGAFFREVRDFSAPVAPVADRAGLVPFASLMEQARQQWGEGHIARVSISAPGAANARIEVVRDTRDQVSSRPQRLLLDGVSGELLETLPASGPLRSFHDILYGLHLAHFADPLLRALLLISGLGGSAMIATGLQLWVVKRRGSTATGLYRRIEGLNVAVITGLPLAMAAFLWANHLLPVELAGREYREVQVFFVVWLCSLVHAQWRSARQVWREQALLCALAFAGLPLLDGLAGGYLASAVNALGVVLGAGFAFMAWRLSRLTSAPPRRREARS